MFDVSPLTLVVPAFNGIAGGNRFTDAGAAIVAELNLARQTALAENQEIEARFYKLPGDAGISRDRARARCRGCPSR